MKVDGVDVRKMTQKDVRDRIGYVPQKGILFSGTIDSNIRYGKTEISEDAVKKQQGLHRLRSLSTPSRSDIRLRSHREEAMFPVDRKQRLSIARAIAKDPEIFIFDDSFSALDFKTDSTLRKALKEHTKEATTIIVAQRISTILNADKILVLDDGHMAGIGSHKELMKSMRGISPDCHESVIRGGIGMSQQRRRGPMGGHGMQPTEKAKDFKGSMKKLFGYMGRYKFRFILMFIFAVAGTAFNIAGPKILGKATTELFNGLVAR